MTLKVGILFNYPTKPLRGESIDYVAEAEVLDQVQAVQEALRKLGLQHYKIPLKGDIEETVKILKEHKPDVVVNLSEGLLGDSSLEMYVPALLELLGIPYTGSHSLALGLCQDKGLAKAVLRANNIPTPRYQIMSGADVLKRGLKFPLFVKPLREDASIGITKRSFVRNMEELRSRVEYVNRVYGQPALVEEYIGGREFNVSILGNEEPMVLPISEIIFEFEGEPRIVDYAAKWLRDSEEYIKTRSVCPAKLDEKLRVAVERTALKAYRALGCRDYARVDIRLKEDAGTPYVLEVNPNPDISLEAGFVRSLKAAGIPFEEFVRRILGFALKRSGRSVPWLG